MAGRGHPRSWYSETALPQPDHPPLAGDLRCDVCIVGGGYTGLSAALHLAERGYDTVLLEAERIGWGASGRNGGQIVTAYNPSMGTMEGWVGKDDARLLWELGEESKRILADRVERHAIDCDLRWGYVLAALKRRFPELPDPHKEDICYATTNRQEAVKRLGEGCGLVLVVGSKNSSNSARLVDVALKAGAGDARLVDDAGDLDWSWFDGVETVGLTAGASAPEPLVQGVIEALGTRFDVTVTEDDGARETVTFKLPRALTA